MQNTLEIHPVIRRHLNSLGLSKDKELRNFLFPSLADLPSPFLLKSIDIAADLIIESIIRKNDILIWGDYDVDGITATSLLYLFFKHLGVKTICYIPDRLSEGYGLNGTRLREFATKLSRDKLLITVDCGISNSEELLLAKGYGFKTIVTDHHQVPEGSLFADATINPKQIDCDFPFKDLSGVGVAFYLAAAVRSKIRSNEWFKDNKIPNLKHFLGLVAIGTIADVMPLIGINRLLTKGGFESVQDTKFSGLKSIFSKMDIGLQRLTSESISYGIAPTINAAGRLGEPSVALDMLTTESKDKAGKLASRLISLNNKRKDICRLDLDKTLSKLNKESILRDNCIICLDVFHEGVLGIIASRLVDQFKVPALVCCYNPQDKTKIKGSGRAPEGFDLYSLLNEVRNFMTSFGGHKLAAGFSLPAESFLDFEASFKFLTAHIDIDNIPINSSLGDKILNLSVSEAFNPLILDNLLQLEPTGEGNPKPVFRDDQAQFISHSYLGKSKEHLKGTMRGKYSNVNVIGFNIGQKASMLNLNKPCEITYRHSLETYNGQTSWKIHLMSIR